MSSKLQYKLGELCVRLTDGSHNPPKGVNFSDYVMISSVNVCNDNIDLTKGVRYLSKEDFERENKRTQISEGDVLLTIVGTVGRASVVKAENNNLTLQRSVAVLSPKKDIVKSQYLKYLLQAESPKLVTQAHGVAQKGIYLGQLSDVNVSVPSLDEQQRIVSELDRLASIISDKQQQLRELDNLAQAIFYSMFGDPLTNPKGWEMKKFGDIGTLRRGGGFLKSDYVESGFPCIHYGQIHMKFGAFVTKHLTEIPNALVKDQRVAHKGDVIIAITSEDLEGSCKSVAWLGDYGVAVGAHAAIFTHNQDAMYISYYTQTKAFYNEKERYARGFKVMEIKPDDIARIPIVLPPLDLQQQFAEKVKTIEEQKDVLKQSIAEFENLLAQRMELHFA